MLSRNTGLWMAYVAAFALLALYIYFAALQHFYLFNSDHAIQIMMAHYFSWDSSDFYYWGQNRLGSLIPLLLLFPIKLLHLPALLCGVGCSCAFYLLALLVLFALARGPLEKVAALAAFFSVPIGSYVFLLYTGHPYGATMSLSLLAFAISFRAPPSTARLVVSGALLGISFWVSEASMAATGAMLLLLFERRTRWKINAGRVIALLAGTACIVPLIVYWRRQIGYEGPGADYVKPADVHMLALGLKRLFPQFSYMVASEQGTLPVGAWFVALVLIAVNGLVLVLRQSLIDEAAASVHTPTLTFLALHNVAYFVMILVSRHSYFGEGQIQRYWVPVVIYSLYMTLVVAARALARLGLRSRAAAFVSIAAAVVIGMLALNIPVWPTHAEPNRFQNISDHWRDLETAREHGATRVTGDYWRALPLNVLSEFEILAVPRDFSRTARFAPEFRRKLRKRNPQMFLDLN
jgi:hypothetical protein